MSNISIGNLNDNYFSIDFAGKTDPTDTYRFNQLNTGSFRVTAEGFSSIVGMQLLDSQGKVVKDIETNGTNSGTFSIDNLGATNYALKISAPSGDTNYQVSLTPDGKVDPLTGLGVDSGFFATDSTGKVGFDWLHDGGNYQGEVAIFSVQGMEKFTPGSEEFIKEAARRVLSNSLFGHVVISDPTESANPLFNGSLGEGNDNQGQYSGRKTFAMKPGEAFAVMLVPNGTVQEVFNNPNAGGDKRPLLSLSSSNPNDAWLYGQVADVTGSGKAFAMEDQRVDTGSDKDYNDLVFNLTGATGKAVSIDKVIDPAKDWTKLDGGKKLIDYVKSKQPIVEPPVAVGPSVQTKPPVAVGPPIETKPPVAVTPPVATAPVETKPPVAVAPPVETPPVETKPPVAVAPPVETPPVETKPPVAVAPPVETPPIETKPPVAVAPPVETKLPVAVAPPIETTPSLATLPIAPPTPPVQPPTIAPEAPLLGLGPIDDLSQPIDPERPIEPVLPISSPPENRAFIGIFDTGFATNNPDLDYSKVTLGRDRIDKDSNPLFTAGTGNEHGTFSWGLVSAIQGNDKGIDGYNDKANVYLSRAIGSGEWDLALTDFVGEAKAQKQKNAIALLPVDLTQKNADGSITTRYEFTPRERAALENARQNGVLLVVAAGNDGGVMSVLGQSSQEFENILTVGSSDGFGRSDYSSYGYGLDILVPGGAIDNPTLSTVGDDIGTMSGTSASAAIAAGMASKVWESNPDLNPTQVIDILTGSAIDLKEPGWDEETGFGVVNLNKAVQLAKETTPQSYTPSPFITPITWDGEGKVTPMERATQNWNAVGDGRRKYVGWLNSSNTSDKLSFTVNQTIPLFQFSLNFLEGSAKLYDSNGNTIASAAQTSNILYGTANLAPGNYYVLVDKGSRSAIDPYEAVLNFTGLSGEVKPLDDTILLPRPTLTPSPTPIQIVGEIGKEYLKIGGESRMGKPLQNQVEQANGFIKQLFEKGYMIWNGSKVATVNFGGVKAAVSSPSSIPSANVDTSKYWKAEVYKWDRGINETKPSGKLSEATPQSNFRGSFSLGSNSQKGLTFDWGKGSPNGNSQFPANNFVIKTYTDTDFEANKTYKFSARGDDGFRLFARPLDKPDAWELITPITDTSLNPDTRPWWQEYYSNPKEYEFKFKESGKYRVVALFYDRDSNANFDLSWQELALPVSSGSYYPTLSKDDAWWDGQSGDNTQFEQAPVGGGVDQRWKTDDKVEQIYTDISTAILGKRSAMTTGYAYDSGYYPTLKKDGKTILGSHSGIDIASENYKDDIKSATRGKVAKIVDDETKNKNGYWVAIDEIDNNNNKTGRRWWYGHLSQPNIAEGKTVVPEQSIAKAGHQEHLHLTVVNTSSNTVSYNEVVNGRKFNDYNKDVQDVLARTISPLEAYWKYRNGMKE
jgi:hypothetical protein